MEKLLASFDHGREQHKVMGGKPGNRPLINVQKTLCVPAAGTIEEYAKDLQVKYNGIWHSVGEEAALFQDTRPDTSDVMYFQGDRVSPLYYCSLFSSLERICRQLQVSSEVHVDAIFTIPEQHRRHEKHLGELLKGTHTIEFTDTSRTFHLAPRFFVHQPKGLVYAYQYAWNGSSVQPKNLRHGYKLLVIDLGSVTVYSGLYVWDKKHGLWVAPSDDFFQGKLGYYNLLEKYRQIAGISPQEDEWRLLRRWEEEPPEIRAEVIRQYAPALNVLRNSRQVDAAVVGGGGYYDLKGILPIENAKPLSQEPHLDQVWGNWMLLHYWYQMQAHMI